MNRLQFFLILLVLCTNIPQSTSRPIQPEQVVTAIDCGSDQPYKSSDGIIYVPDNQYTTNSKIADYSFSPALLKKKIKFTDDQQLYKTERHADSQFAYSIQPTAPGIYTLILKFCELYYNESNKRVFDVLLGNTIVASGVDIAKEVGPFAALDVYIEFEKRTNNEYFYKGTQIADTATEFKAINSTGLSIKFRPVIGKDLPKVDAILVLRGGLAESNQNEYKELVKSWEERTASAQQDEEHPAKRLETLRSTLKDEYDTALDLQVYNSSKFEGVIDVLLSWKGILILMTLIIFQVCLFCFEDAKEELAIERKSKQSPQSQSSGYPTNPNHSSSTLGANTAATFVSSSSSTTTSAATATNDSNTVNPQTTEKKENKKRK